MKITGLTFVLFFFCNLLFAQSDDPVIGTEAIVIGDQVQLNSSILNESRTINIYLPHNYSQDSLKTYPVIYLLDGSMDEDFIHISGIVQFGSFSWIKMIPESIVVGIGNVDRKRDFTYPSQDETDQKELPTSGGSAAFMDFLQSELQPMINSRYRTTDLKTIIGQSLGGLLATEILFKNPDLFDNYIIVSPSLWWDDEKLLEKNPVSYRSTKSIYIAGGKEGEVMERTAKELFEKLDQNKGDNTKVYYEFLEDKSHGDALHIAVYHAFEKIFRHDSIDR